MNVTWYHRVFLDYDVYLYVSRIDWKNSNDISRAFKKNVDVLPLEYTLNYELFNLTIFLFQFQASKETMKMKYGDIKTRTSSFIQFNEKNVSNQ